MLTEFKCDICKFIGLETIREGMSLPYCPKCKIQMKMTCREESK